MSRLVRRAIIPIEMWLLPVPVATIGKVTRWSRISFVVDTVVDTSAKMILRAVSRLYAFSEVGNSNPKSCQYLIEKANWTHFSSTLSVRGLNILICGFSQILKGLRDPHVVGVVACKTPKGIRQEG